MTGSNNLGGDADLQALVVDPTYDASVLEFDFITVSDSAVFNFVFGSEEYNEFVNSTFNDVFAFFISGPGITGLQNIAMLPVFPPVPVSINNLNNGYSIPATPASGPCTNCAYFQDNTLGTYTTEYDGLTSILMAVAANLQPGETYHLKIAIADVGDHAYDSGVIIQTGSFTAPNDPWIYVNGQRLTSTTIPFCPDSSFTLSAPAGFTYLWSNGSTEQSLTITEAGTYSVQIFGSNPNEPVSSGPINVVIDPSCTTGLAQLSPDQQVSVYPNPFRNSCTLSFVNPSNEKYAFSLVDVTGRIVMQKEINSSKTIIDRNNIESGIYMYQLTNLDRTKTFKGKIVVE
jgi:hypothetical protein